MAFFDVHTHEIKGLDDQQVFSIFNYLTFQSKEFIQPPDFLNLFFSVGVHPWYINFHNYKNQLNTLNEQLSSNDKIVAIGECGLDKLIDNFSLQQDVFIEHIKLANFYKLPILIHCVKAWEQLFKILKTQKIEVPCIIHGYRGNRELTLQLEKYDFYFSLGEKYNMSALNSIPKSKLLLETDNSNLSIKNIYFRIAQDLKITENELEIIIERNVNIFTF